MLNEESTNVGLVSCEKTLFQKIFYESSEKYKDSEYESIFVSANELIIEN